jgi:hypothetical protein
MTVFIDDIMLACFDSGCCDLLPIRPICGMDSKLRTRQHLKSALSASVATERETLLSENGIDLPLTTGEARLDQGLGFTTSVLQIGLTVLV